MLAKQTTGFLLKAAQGDETSDQYGQTWRVEDSPWTDLSGFLLKVGHTGLTGMRHIWGKPMRSLTATWLRRETLSHREPVLLWKTLTHGISRETGRGDCELHVKQVTLPWGNPARAVGKWRGFESLAPWVILFNGSSGARPWSPGEGMSCD